MKRLWPILLVLVGVAVLSLVLLVPQSSPSVALHVVRSTNDSAGVETVVFQVTNISRKAFACAYQAQVLTNGFWTTPGQVTGHQISGFFRTHSLSGTSAFESSFTTPVPGMRWRVLVFYSDPPGTIRARIDSIFQKIRIPFRVNRKHYLVTQEFPRDA